MPPTTPTASITTLMTSATVMRRWPLAGERLELAAQPRRRRDREALLAAVDDLARQQQLERLAQEHLLLKAAHLLARRQPQCKISDSRIQERDASLERMRHRRPVGLD